MLQVVILRDGLLVGTEVLVPGAYAVGSAPGSDLRLEDSQVAPRHAVLYFQHGRAAIQDSGGAGGVYVNGHRVSTCEVRSLDEVAIGPFLLKLRALAQGKPKSAPPPEVAALLRGGPPPQTSPAEPVTAPGQPRAGRPPAGASKTVPSARKLAETALYQSPPTEIRKAPVPPGRPVRAASPPAKSLPGSRRLFLELYWGEVRQEARSFRTLPASRPLLAGQGEKNLFPLFGFGLSEQPFLLAESAGEAFRVFVPSSAAVEWRLEDGNFYPAPPEQLASMGKRRFLTLSSGMAARFSEGEMSLLAYVQPAEQSPWVNPLRGQPWLAICLFLVLLVGMGTFLHFAPKPVETADFQQRNLPPVAVRLIAPEPKKKEAAAKKLEQLKQKAGEKKEKSRVEKLPKSNAAESPAIKALAKLTAAGPASRDILAMMDKLGSGPGSKLAKRNDLKLTGLLGKAPLANAGLGSFGLGGGGGGGQGTRGVEMLRGHGSGGIGALGAGGVGRGPVGGTVMRASARSVAVQGSIDREAVARVVNSHLQEVRACYERALLREPGLAGKVVLEWTIATNGKVVTAKTKSSTLKHASVESCILASLKGWSFPPARGGQVIVSYPFLFNSVGY